MARARRGRRRRGAALALAALASAALAAGCGGGGGVEAGATVHVYVAAQLCPEAQRELAGGGGQAGDVRLRVVCLSGSRNGGRVDLAAAGADARRATEDSTAIAYVEASGPAAKFAAPIVEGAGLAFLETSSGTNATEQVERAVGEAGDGSLRDEVAKALTGAQQSG